MVDPDDGPPLESRPPPPERPRISLPEPQPGKGSLRRRGRHGHGSGRLRARHGGYRSPGRRHVRQHGSSSSRPLRSPGSSIRDMDEGDLDRYVVVRIADEFVVDLLKAACGVEYQEACELIDEVEVQGVPIPFANPESTLANEANNPRKGSARSDVPRKPCSPAEGMPDAGGLCLTAAVVVVPPGFARSKARAARSTSASAPHGPTICSPTGPPLLREAAWYRNGGLPAEVEGEGWSPSSRCRPCGPCVLHTIPPGKCARRQRESRLALGERAGRIGSGSLRGVR